MGTCDQISYGQRQADAAVRRQVNGTVVWWCNEHKAHHVGRTDEADVYEILMSNSDGTIVAHIPGHIVT